MASSWPSGLNATVVTPELPASVNVARRFWVAMSKRAVFPFRPLMAIVLPSGLKATEETGESPGLVRMTKLPETYANVTYVTVGMEVWW